MRAFCSTPPQMKHVYEVCVCGHYARHTHTNCSSIGEELTRVASKINCVYVAPICECVCAWFFSSRLFGACICRTLGRTFPSGRIFMLLYDCVCLLCECICFVYAHRSVVGRDKSVSNPNTQHTVPTETHTFTNIVVEPTKKKRTHTKRNCVAKWFFN